jgi:DMSO/TMAO reductase YedYZ molybdopterin-dependent catalytic subunit
MRRETRIRLDDHRPTLLRLERRLMLQRGLSLGALTMLTGCNLQDGDAVDRVLWTMSRWNDRVQAWLFHPNRLAPTYPASAITNPFPFNAFYPVDDAPEIDGDDYALELSGRVADKRSWTLAKLRLLPQESQITRHICIEGWSAFGKWTGVRFSDFLARIGADLSAKYVTFRCDDNYITSIDMPTALYPQTQLAFWFDGEVLPRKYGFPTKLRIPTKLGFKNPKHIGEIEIGNNFNGGYWET